MEVECYASYKKGADGKLHIENGVNKEVVIHRFYGAVSINGNLYRVRTTIKENLTNNGLANSYTYQLDNIEVNATKPALTSIGAGESSKVKKTTLEAAKLLKGIRKSYAPERENSSYVLDIFEIDQHQR